MISILGGRELSYGLARTCARDGGRRTLVLPDETDSAAVYICKKKDDVDMK